MQRILPNPWPGKRPTFCHCTLILKDFFFKSKISFKFHGTDANFDIIGLKWGLGKYYEKI